MVGLVSLVFRTLTCSRSRLELLIRRSPPRLFTAAARTGLRPAPESRSRGAIPHLSRSFTTPLLGHFTLLSLGFCIRSERRFFVGGHPDPPPPSCFRFWVAGDVPGPSTCS